MKIILTSLTIIISLYANSQTTIVDSIFTGGQWRSYRLYKPAIFTGVVARPLILNLHGYTSNALQQEQYTGIYGGFKAIADTANFLMVYPNGTYSNGNRFWNAGLSSTGVNDIAFLSALIDSLKLIYNIDLNRIYSTGMSNGGFMSHTLACELGNRITAIASVTGSIFKTQSGPNCNPTHPTPVMQIHGTSDATVPYIGASTMEPIDSVVKYWVRYNNCNATPTFSNVPNTSLTDGCTAEHYKYSGGNLGSTVELYKIIGGTHSWPGFPFGGAGTNMDINASKEIWRFFSKYKLNMLTSVINDFESNKLQFDLYPNPTITVLNINFKTDVTENYSLQITDVVGKIVAFENNNGSKLDVSDLNSGIYFLSIITNNNVVSTKKFIKN